jgi:hypothetical protein
MMSEIAIKPRPSTSYKLDWSLWRQWVLANAIGEFIGLGGTALLGIMLFTQSDKMVGPVALVVVMVLGGTFLEGVMVGVWQWLALRKAIQQIRWQTWLIATAAGAFTAWLLGMIPSTIMTMTETQEAAAPSTELSNWVVLGLAAVMGLVLGPILGLPQWWVLRQHLQRASWWVPANALAWMAGMVLIFAGTSLMPEEGITATIVLVMLTILLLAGAVVGAIHGLVLIWLIKQRSFSWT